MKGKCIVLDGPSGMVKSTLVSALATRLEDDDIAAIVSNDITLIDCLASGEPVKVIRKHLASGKVCLVSTNHIYELSKKFYKDYSKLKYDTVNNAIKIAHEMLAADLVIVIDSLPRSAEKSNIRRGYLWEAKQRRFEVLSSIGDVEPIFEKIANLVNSKRVEEEPVRLKEVLKAKKLPHSKKKRPTKK